MFVPLYDGVPMRRIRYPAVNYALIAANLAIFLVTVVFPGEEFDLTDFAAGFGAIPSVIFGLEILPDGLPYVPAPLTFVTGQFFHISWIHLLGNLLVLQVFGDNVEDALGHWRYLAFYLLCGTAGGLAHALIDIGSMRPLVGASAAISGIIAAYLLLHPRVKVWGLVLFRIPLRLRAIWGIGLWGSLQVWQALSGGDDSTGWFAHVGGFAAGLVLVLILRPKDQPLFGAADGPELTGDN